MDVLETADYIRDNASLERAAAWKNGLLKAVYSLTEMPNRCSVPEESGDVGQELRELHFYSHRVIFQVDENTSTVRILRVYHCAREPLRPEDFSL